MFPEQEKLPKSLHSDTPYLLSVSSFNQYVKQNEKEFNREYERHMKNNIKSSSRVKNKTGNKSDKLEARKDGLAKTCNGNKTLTAGQTPSKITENAVISKQTVHNKQLEQTLRTQHRLPTCSTDLTTSAVEKTQIFIPRDCDFYGFCYSVLNSSTCRNPVCPFKHKVYLFTVCFYQLFYTYVLI